MKGCMRKSHWGDMAGPAGSAGVYVYHVHSLCMEYIIVARYGSKFCGTRTRYASGTYPYRVRVPEAQRHIFARFSSCTLQLLFSDLKVDGLAWQRCGYAFLELLEQAIRDSLYACRLEAPCSTILPPFVAISLVGR